MRVELNGRFETLAEGATLVEALALVGVGQDSRGVAVAVEGEVVPRAKWRSRGLAEGESVEVVRAVQGG